jgi:hypothetical protein
MAQVSQNVYEDQHPYVLQRLWRDYFFGGATALAKAMPQQSAADLQQVTTYYAAHSTEYVGIGKIISDACTAELARR